MPRKNVDLLLALRSLPLFPIKNSYVAYLRTDPKALERNPQTVNRICGRLYELGLTNLWTKCSQPKETNRQIGPMFQRWVKNGGLGIIPVSVDEFLSSNDNAVLDGSDRSLMRFAQKHLGYKRNKGLDLVARFNGKYVIAEAKFLTAYGGHQNASFNDAITLLKHDCDAYRLAILDGVLYINQGQSKMYESLCGIHSEADIMSVLVLREFFFTSCSVLGRRSFCIGKIYCCMVKI